MSELTLEEKRRLDWTRIGRWAGWEQGKQAKRRDREVQELYGLSRATVERHRRRVGALPRDGRRVTWPDADYRRVMRLLAQVGRTPSALLGEHVRRRATKEPAP